MKIKTVIIVSLIAVVYSSLMNLMNEFGALNNVSNVIKVGLEYEYGGIHTYTVDATWFILHIPYYICYFIFFTVFVWRVKDFAPKWIGYTAFVFWVIAILFKLADVFRVFYIVSNYSGETIMPESLWDARNSMGKYVLFTLFDTDWYSMNRLAIFLLYILLMVVFVFSLKKDKALGVAGIVAMVLCVFSLAYLPYAFVAWNAAWILLLSVSLWRVSVSAVNIPR